MSVFLYFILSVENHAIVAWFYRSFSDVFSYIAPNVYNINVTCQSLNYPEYLKKDLRVLTEKKLILQGWGCIWQKNYVTD